MMARGEWRWVAIVSIVTMAATTAPTLAGYLAQTPDLRFVGAVYGVQDYHSHLAKMQLGARGEFRYRSLFTAEPHRSEPIILNDIALGFAASRLGISLPLAYELGRWAGGLALLLAAYRFIALILPGVSTRRLAFALAVASGGLGWLVVRHPAFSYPHPSPIDFWLADAYLFFSIMAFPQFGWSIAALLLSLIVWWRYAERPQARWLAFLVGLNTFHGFMQIFELPLFDAVIGLDALRRAIWDRRSLKPSLAAGLVLVPVQALMVWPYVHALQTNPMVAVWNQQSRTLSPPPIYYLIGYGLLWPLVALGLAWAWRRRDERLAFCALWVSAAAVLVYSPNNIQYRWLEGVQVPLAILAAVGLEQVLTPGILRGLPLWAATVRWRWRLTALVVIATMPSTLYLVAGNTLLAATHWPDVFLTGGEAGAIDWLGGKSRPDDLVLAELKVGNAIPGRIGRRVFYGHWAETLYVSQKRALVAAFFSNMSDADRRALLRDYDVRYVFFGPGEHSPGGFDPGRAPYLAERFRSADSTIYEVVAP